MRTFLIVLLAGFLLGSLAANGVAIPLCSYSPPESRLATLALSFDYRFFDDQYRDNTTTGSLAMDFSNLFDSASYGYNTTVNAKAGYNGGAMSYSGLGSGSYQMYLDGGDLFGFGSAVMRASSAYESPGLNVVTGSGYGRFRDVTPLAKAMLMGKALEEMGSIEEPLPDETLIAIAQEIGRKIEYENIDELVKKVAQLIEQADLVSAPDGILGPVAILRIEEIVGAEGDKRLCGYDLRGGLGYEIIDPLGNPQDFLAFVGLDYATTPNVDSQFRFKLNFTSSFKLFEDYSVDGLVTFGHRLGPTLSSAASYTLMRTKQPGEEPVDTHLLDLKAAFEADAGWDLTAKFSLKWESGYDQWSKELSITGNYTVF